MLDEIDSVELATSSPTAESASSSSAASYTSSVLSNNAVGFCILRLRYSPSAEGRENPQQVRDPQQGFAQPAGMLGWVRAQIPAPSVKTFLLGGLPFRRDPQNSS